MLRGNWGSGNISFQFKKRPQPQIFTFFGKTQICQIRKILILSVHCIGEIERFAETRASGAPTSSSAESPQPWLLFLPALPEGGGREESLSLS